MWNTDLCRHTHSIADSYTDGICRLFLTRKGRTQLTHKVMCMCGLLACFKLRPTIIYKIVHRKVIGRLQVKPLKDFWRPYCPYMYINPVHISAYGVVLNNTPSPFQHNPFRIVLIQFAWWLIKEKNREKLSRKWSFCSDTSKKKKKELERHYMLVCQLACKCTFWLKTNLWPMTDDPHDKQRQTSNINIWIHSPNENEVKTRDLHIFADQLTLQSFFCALKDLPIKSKHFLKMTLQTRAKGVDEFFIFLFCLVQLCAETLNFNFMKILCDLKCLNVDLSSVFYGHPPYFVELNSWVNVLK